LDFNARVLALAEDESQPLLERAKFVAIFASNLDEFYMVRVAGLKRRAETGLSVRSADGLNPREQLAYISKRNQELVERHARAFQEGVRPELAAHGHPDPELDRPRRTRAASADHLLQRAGLPGAHPAGRGLRAPVPLHLRTLAQPRGDRARPAGRGRAVRPGQGAGQRAATGAGARRRPDEADTFLPLEALIAAHLSDLFTGMQVTEVHAFRVTRNADLEVEEDQDEDLLEALERELAQRRFGPPVRLEVADDMSEQMMERLLRELEVHPNDVVVVGGLIDLSCLWQLTPSTANSSRTRPFVPTTHPAFADRETPKSVFATLREEETCWCITRTTRSPPACSGSSSRPRAIRRCWPSSRPCTGTSGDSPIVDALIDAAEAGKQVVALVEIKARFDEQANIKWARTLEKAGVHVVYGLVGLKTHCKTALVVRQDGATIRRYCHIGTGNYNPKTARLYEDVGLLTAEPTIGADLTDLFNVLTGYARQDEYRSLLVAPYGIRRGIVERIAQEVEHRQAGRPAGIRLRSTLGRRAGDRRAVPGSQAGVPVDIVGARDLRAQAGNRRTLGAHSGALDPRPVPRALPGVPLRRLRRALDRQRRSHAPQPGPAGRGRGADHRSEAHQRTGRDARLDA
jgi:polyphosphate kinase